VQAGELQRAEQQGGAEHHRGVDHQGGRIPVGDVCLEYRVPDCLLWKANKRVYESLCGRDRRAPSLKVKADRPSLPAERLESQVSCSYSLEW